MSDHPNKIAVVGCGIAGLSIGMLLAKAGHEITLFERFEEPKSIGAGILLQPSGMVALDQLGLLEEVQKNAARVEALVGVTTNGRRVMDIRYADVWPGWYGLGVHRGNLFGALYKAATAAGVEVRYGVSVIDVKTDGAGKYACRVLDGEVFDGYDGVVVADGAASSLRSCLNVRQRYVPYPWGALWAICPDPERRFRDALLQRYDRASVMIGVLPTGVHPQTGVPCASFFWSLRTKDYPDWLRGDLEEWKAHVLGYWPELKYLIGEVGISAFAFGLYGDVIMKRWNDGGIVCIGDAGHGMSPQLGQGANLALIDALVLADCVDQMSDLPAAFARYSRLRRRHLRYCERASRWLTPFFQSDSRAPAYVRDIFFPLLNKVPYVYREALRTVAGVKTGLLFGKPIVDLGKRGPDVAPGSD